MALPGQTSESLGRSGIATSGHVVGREAIAALTQSYQNFIPVHKIPEIAPDIPRSPDRHNPQRESSLRHP